MPIESLNLQIIIPKSYEAENYINAYRNISKNTKEIEFILNSREADNSYKKVNSANNINSNVLVINDDYNRERKNNYSSKENSSKKGEISNDDSPTEDIGKNINIKI